jgi:hypothetical protein
MSSWNLASTQSGGSKTSKASMRDSERLLLERNRNLLHLGDPLTIVGIDQGGKEFRSETPALLQSDKAHVQVDPEELRRRELAIYDRGDLFSVPTAPAADPTPTQEAPPAELQPHAPARGVQGVKWFVGVGSVLAALGLLAALRAGPWKKGRSSRRTTSDGPIRVQVHAPKSPTSAAHDVDAPAGIRSTRSAAASIPQSSRAPESR